jgi:hypothetical protein
MSPTSGETNIQGSNGTWTFHIDKNPGNRKDDVTITFVPKAGVNCKDIRIIQAVSLTAMDRHGVPFKGMPENLIFKRGQNPFAHRKGVMVRGTDGNQWSIDYNSCEADPYFNGDDALHDIGEHGPDKSSITDNPGSDFTDVNVGIDFLEMNFETCAVCNETGECLGCIKWRATAHRGGKQGESELIDPLAPDPCSETVPKATKAFVKTHTKVDDDGVRRWFCPDDNTFGPEIPPKAYKRFMDVMLALRQIEMRPYREDTRIGNGTLITEAEAVLAAAQADPVRAAIKFTWAGTQSRTIPSLIVSASDELTPEDLLPFEQNDPRLDNDFVAMRNLVTNGTVILRSFEMLLREQGLSGIKEDDPISLLFAVGLKTERPAALPASASREDLSRFVATMLERPDLDEDLIKGLGYLQLNMCRKKDDDQA